MRVTGEQHAVGRQMDCDAAFGMAGNLEDVRAAAEIEHVAVVQFLIYCCRRRYGGQSGRNPFVDGEFPVLEHRWRHVGFATDDGGIACACHDRRAG